MSASRTVARLPALVVGLGSIDRGDDAIGVHVARAVAAVAAPEVEVVEHEDPTDLVELWTDRDDVVVVDAVWSGAGVPPGSLRLLVTGAELAPLPESAWVRTGRGGTHAFGLATAVELARALHRLPARVTVVGVEAGVLEHGAPLSPEVAAAIPTAVDAVLDALGATTSVVPDGRGRTHVPG